MIPMKPQVSVLLPCFNAAGHLESCLESLLAQSLEDFEILAIDDGSDDETPELLERAAGKDRRIRVFHRPHQGIAKSLAAAAVEARAPLLARMDADDICDRRRLELQASYLKEHYLLETHLAGRCRVAIWGYCVMSLTALLYSK